GLGIDEIPPVLRIVDKLSKIGPDEVQAQLVQEAKLRPEQAVRCLELSTLQGGLEVIERVRALGVEHELLEAGLHELHEVLRAAAELPPGTVVADLGIARGFDYYTGTVYEAFLQGLE